jgi:hypothetical protein
MELLVCTSYTIGNIKNVARWEDNNKMGLQEVGWGGMDWIDLTKDKDRWRAIVNMVMNFRVP